MSKPRDVPAPAPEPATSADTLFLDTIRHQRRGECLNELGEELRRLVGLVLDSHSKGTLIFQLEVKPNGQDGASVQLIDSVKIKEPKKPSGGMSIFFADSENNLTRNDPNQPNLPFDRSL